MQQATRQLHDFGVAYEEQVISAHRSPDLLFDYIKEVSVLSVQCFITGAAASGGSDCRQDHVAGAGRADSVKNS